MFNTFNILLYHKTNRHYCPSEAHTSAVTLLGRGPRPKTVKVAGTSKYELNAKLWPCEARRAKSDPAGGASKYGLLNLNTLGLYGTNDPESPMLQ